MVMFKKGKLLLEIDLITFMLISWLVDVVSRVMLVFLLTLIDKFFN